MLLIRSSAMLKQHLNALRKTNPKISVGFVPTMGALHDGHGQLIRCSVNECNITVCSVFVNPTQFGDVADLANYPKPIEQDIELLANLCCDILFLPEYDQVYPPGYIQQKFDLAGLDVTLEGASRPGHFQGVCNVLARFFEIIEPSAAYFGQKDFQQTVVVKRLVKLRQLAMDVKVVPIKRELHGLAMSSRNARLSSKGRNNAAFIFQALSMAKNDFLGGMELEGVLTKARQFINAQKGANVDYLAAVDTETLDFVTTSATTIGRETAILTVVEYEDVRLLDNIIL